MSLAHAPDQTLRCRYCRLARSLDECPQYDICAGTHRAEIALCPGCGATLATDEK